MTAAYRDALALIHHDGFTDFARCAADVLLEQLQKDNDPGGLVVDLGCGSGVLARRLTDAGYDVLGIDLSPAMIALARRQAPRARFRVESLLTAELPPCRAVTAIGECFNYLFDAANTHRTRAKALRRIYQSLAPGGVLLLDISEPGRAGPEGGYKSFRETDDWTVLVSVTEDRPRRELTRNITTFRRAGRHFRRDQEIHRLRLIPRSEMREQLRAAGFRVRTLSGYRPQKFFSSQVGFLARKP